MYLQITTRCNMSCPHCCYSCTQQGDDMSQKTFNKAVKLCQDRCDSIFLGGGEPTMHPKFEGFLIQSIAASCENDDMGKVGIITNGSIKKRALLIASLSKAEVISGFLSQDQYHDPIDDAVVSAFKSIEQAKAYEKGVWDTSHGGRRTPLPHGRAIEFLGLDEDHKRTDRDCPCPGWMIKPNGDIRQCGCDDSPIIGNIFDGYPSIDEDEISAYDCWLYNPNY